MGAVGHGSNRDLLEGIRNVQARLARLAPPGAGTTALRRYRRPPGEMTQAVSAVLGSSGELGVQDICGAVEALLNAPVSPSSVKNCLATYSRGYAPSFERVGRGRYRLRSTAVGAVGSGAREIRTNRVA